MRCSKATSACRPGFTVPATCNARSCCSIRPTRRRSDAPSPSATRALGATVVLSPALGGIVIGQEVGRGLGVRAIFAERQEGTLMLRRGFALADTDRVLVVEDVVTTGGSTRETMQVARAAGAQVVGAAAMVNRNSGPRRDLGVPFTALLDIALPTYEPTACPLCAQGVAVVKPGSRPVVA